MPDRLTPRYNTCPAVLRLLLLSAALLLNTDNLTAQHDSQRPLPLPPAAAAGSDTHLELLRRLRETLNQAEQTPPAPPQQLTTPGQPSAQQSALEPDSAAAPPQHVPLEDLMQLGSALQKIAPQFPQELFPKDLLDRPPAELLSAFQHPDTQQRLQEMIQQFRRDGLMPQDPDDPADDDAPPQATDGRIPRTSLRSLDRFLREFRQNLPPLENHLNPQNNTPARPLRRRDATVRQPDGRPRLLTPMPSPNDGLPNQNQDQLDAATDSPPQNADNSSKPPQVPPDSGSAAGNPRLGMPREIESQPAEPQQPLDSAGNAKEDSAAPSETNSNSADSSAEEPAAIPLLPNPDNKPGAAAPPEIGLSALQQLFQQFADPGQLLNRGSRDQPPSPQPAEDNSQKPSASQPSPQRPSSENAQQPADDTAVQKLPQDFSLREFIEQQLRDPRLQQQQQDWPAGNRSDEINQAQSDAPRIPPPPERDLSAETAQSLQSRGLGSTLRDLMNRAREQAEQPRPDDNLLAPLTDLFSPKDAPALQDRPAVPSRQPRPPQSPGLLEKMRESVAGILDELRPQIERMSSDSGDFGQLSPEQLQELAQRMQLSPEEIESLVRAQGGEDAATLPGTDSLQQTDDTASSGDWSSAIRSSLQLLALLAAAAAMIPLIRWVMQKKLQQQEQQHRVIPAPEGITATGDIVAAFHRLTRATVQNAQPWWNHKQMSSELQQRFPQQQQSVQSLSGFYERARYRPPSAALNESDLRQIRTDLGSLIAARNAD